MKTNNPWQPMSTAPHDGTVVDLFHKGGFRVTEQWWVDEERAWVGVFSDEDFIAWMPLPVYPDVAAIDDQGNG